MFRDEACIYDEVQDTQDDELQQNDAYSTQVLQLKQNVCYDSFFGENFQQQRYNYIYTNLHMLVPISQDGWI